MTEDYRAALGDWLKDSFVVQARFIYERDVYGEWTTVNYSLPMVPNSNHRVISVQHRVVGPDGQDLPLTPPKRSRSGARRWQVVKNGESQ